MLKTEEPIGYMALALAYKRREISYDEFNSGVKKLETNNTDWFDILFQTPFSHNHSISVSGGNAKTTYRASIGVNNANNTAKGNSQKSYSGNVNVSTTFWDQLYITFGLSGNVSKTKAFNAANPYSYASTTNRAILVITRMVVYIFTGPAVVGSITSCMNYIIVEIEILRIVLIVILVFVG